MTIETLSIDIAKNVFELHGVNHSGRVLLKGRVMRDQLLAVRRFPIDARLSSKPAREHLWARKFEALGHQVKLISPQYLKPFVYRQRTTANDAEAICTASRQPHIPFCSEEDLATGRAVHRGRIESPRIVLDAFRSQAAAF
jgi:transposase